MQKGDGNDNDKASRPRTPDAPVIIIDPDTIERRTRTGEEAEHTNSEPSPNYPFVTVNLFETQNNPPNDPGGDRSQSEKLSTPLLLVTPNEHTAWTNYAITEEPSSSQRPCCQELELFYKYAFIVIGKNEDEYQKSKKKVVVIFNAFIMLLGIRLAYIFGKKNQDAASVAVAMLPDVWRDIFFLSPYASRFFSTFINVWVNFNIEVFLLTRLLDYSCSNEKGREKYDKVYWATYIIGAIIGIPFAYAMALVFVQGYVKEDMTSIDESFMYLDFGIRFLQYHTAFCNAALKYNTLKKTFTMGENCCDAVINIIALGASLTTAFVGYKLLKTVKKNRYFFGINLIQDMPYYIRQACGATGYLLTFGPNVFLACSANGFGEANNELKEIGFLNYQIKFLNIMAWVVAFVTCLANIFDELAEAGMIGNDPRNKIQDPLMIPSLVVNGVSTAGINRPSATLICNNAATLCAKLVNRVRCGSSSDNLNGVDTNIASAMLSLPLIAMFPPLAVITLFYVGAAAHAAVQNSANNRTSSGCCS